MEDESAARPAAWGGAAAHLRVVRQLRAQAERAAPVGERARVARIARRDRTEALPGRDQRGARLAAQRAGRAGPTAGLGGRRAGRRRRQQLQAALFQQAVRQQRVAPVALPAAAGAERGLSEG